MKTPCAPRVAFIRLLTSFMSPATTSQPKNNKYNSHTDSQPENKTTKARSPATTSQLENNKTHNNKPTTMVTPVLLYRLPPHNVETIHWCSGLPRSCLHCHGMWDRKLFLTRVCLFTVGFSRSLVPCHFWGVSQVFDPRSFLWGGYL